MEPIIQELWVEGINDQHVIWGLCEAEKVKQVFSVKELEGISNIILGLRARLEGVSQNETLGIIIDGDLDVKNRWRSILDRLKQIGYNCPTEPNDGGTIIHNPNLPKVGIWIMPDNKNPGTVEDFIQQMIHEDDKLKDRANLVLDELEKEGIDRYRTEDRSKAFIHTWLAWQEKPGVPMGLGIRLNYYDLKAPNCQALITWLKRLFEA